MTGPLRTRLEQLEPVVEELVAADAPSHPEDEKVAAAVAASALLFLDTVISITEALQDIANTLDAGLDEARKWR